MNLAENIKKEAKKHGKTISQLAEDLGVMQPHLSRTINSERITLKDLESLAEKIGCNVGDFFPDTYTCPRCGTRLRLVEDD